VAEEVPHLRVSQAQPQVPDERAEVLEAHEPAVERLEFRKHEIEVLLFDDASPHAAAPRRLL